MIPKSIVLDLAEKSGFGGALRHRYYPKLHRFAELIEAYDKERAEAACNIIGVNASTHMTEFMDGKMEGAFSCCDAIQKL